MKQQTGVKIRHNLFCIYSGIQELHGEHKRLVRDALKDIYVPLSPLIKIHLKKIYVGITFQQDGCMNQTDGKEEEEEEEEKMNSKAYKVCAFK